MKICPNCHAENDDTALFCENCGTSLADVPVVAEEIEAAEPQRISPEVPVSAGIAGVSEKSAPASKICRYCGAENPLDAIFCENCGHRFEPEIINNVARAQVESPLTSNAETPVVSQTQPKAQEQVAPPTQAGGNGNGGQVPPVPPTTPQQAAMPQQPAQPKKKMSGLKKFGLIAAVVVVLLAIGGYMFGKNHFSRENQLNAFITAVNSGNAGSTAAAMSSEDTNLKINSASVKPFLAYFKENKAELNKLKQALKNNSSSFGVDFVQKGKIFFIFDKYVADVNSVYGTLAKNIDGAVISFDGEKVATSDSTSYNKKFGPIVPGAYTVEATSKDSSGKEMKISGKKTLKAGDKNTLDLTFTMVAIPIESNIADATVQINGKEVGKLTDGATTIGPLLYEDGMKVQLVKKTDDGELKSEEYEVSPENYPADAVDDSYPLELDFEVADEYDVENGLYDFYDDFADAVETTTSYDPATFASEYYENGQKNEAFTGIGEYIASCRARYDKKEYQGVYFQIEVTSVTPTAQDTYLVNYHVIYNTSYPYATKKDTRIEGFDYSKVKIKLAADADDYDWDFKFVDMGDGGVKVSDNHPELK